MKKIAAGTLLVVRGAFASKQEALPFILSGSVLASGVPVTSLGQMLEHDASLRVKGFYKQFVSRGGHKLSHALGAFGVNVQERVCLDCGASMGGFTDCLLQRGASLVYAIEAGIGQLSGKLRADGRVVNLEGHNIGEIKRETLDPLPSLASLDIGYLTLRKAIPQAAPLLEEDGEMLCLVKPLFELHDHQARRTGIIQDDAYAPLLLKLIDEIQLMGYFVHGITHSPIQGSKGTREFFLHVSKTDANEPVDFTSQVLDSVAAVLSLPTQVEQMESEDGYF